MHSDPTTEASRQALQDIRSIMERSSRFLSLSGWSGIWAGCTALGAAVIAYGMLPPWGNYIDYRPSDRQLPVGGFILLGIVTFLVAFCGAYYFTWRKAKASGQQVWTKASRQLMWQVAVPMAVGGVFCLAFLYYGTMVFIAPACLAFYGLALVSGSKFTLGEIRWLGYCEIALGCIALFVPYYGLAFMAAGFGVLHIVYGAVMWNKYDKQDLKEGMK
jgi:hypothetical protein